jgi:hypothetical protein
MGCKKMNFHHHIFIFEDVQKRNIILAPGLFQVPIIIKIALQYQFEEFGVVAHLLQNGTCFLMEYFAILVDSAEFKDLLDIGVM